MADIKPATLQVAVGNGSAFVLRTIQSSDSSLTIAQTSTHLNFTLPQSVALTATPTFAGMKLLPASAGTDAAIQAQDNVAGVGTTKYVMGYDDSRDTLAFSQGTTLGANGFEVDANGLLNTIANSFALQGARFQTFALEIYNDAGTLKVRFVSLDGAHSGMRTEKLANAPSTRTAIPTVDGTTGFGVVGAGIDATNSHFVWLDTTADQDSVSLCILFCTGVFSNSGTAVVCTSDPVSANIGGTTKNRFRLHWRTNAGVNFGITTGNLANTQYVWANIIAFMK